MTTCKNCSNTFEGKFCPECGQKAKTGRITLKAVFQDIRDHFIHFDKGFLYTIKELTLRPGLTIREYIDGKRVKHVKPVKFMFWATAVSFLVTKLLGFEEQFIKTLEAQQPEAREQAKQMGPKLMNFIMAHPGLLLLCILPVISLVTWLFFRKNRINYAESFTLNAFLMGQLSILSLSINAGYYAMKNMPLQYIAFLGVLQWGFWCTYFAWSYGQFFQGSRKVWIWAKAVFSLLLGYGLMILFMGLIAFITIYFFKSQLDAWLNNG